MSEGSFWPKTWREAVPLAVWGILIFAAGFEGIASLVHFEWLPCIASFAIMGGLMVTLIHWDSIRRTNPNWIVPVACLALLAIMLLPFIEQGRWPFASWFDVATAAQKTTLIEWLQKAQQERDLAVVERNSAQAS